MKSLCRQCTRAISLDALHCPHCGAFHDLTNSETLVWLLQKALIGGIAGAIAGGVIAALVAAGLAAMHDTSGSTKTIVTLSQLGMLCGAMLRGTFKAAYNWYRRDQ
jgi:cation transporter-like permease